MSERESGNDAWKGVSDSVKMSSAKKKRENGPQTMRQSLRQQIRDAVQFTTQTVIQSFIR
jgi:hypothetical protein